MPSDGLHHVSAQATRLSSDGMTSKRNSRVFVDETKHCQVGSQKSSSSSHRSRRDSHGSANDDMSPPAKEAEDGQRVGTMPREAATVARTRSTSDGTRENTVTPSIKIGEKTIVMAAKVSLTRSTEFPPVPLNGRPANFGVVLPGVYRSSYPKPEDYAFLQSLKLKTVVTLVKKDEIDHELESFTSSNGIHQVVFNMKGTKKEAIPLSTMASILRLVLDRQHYPLLVHCNHGKHRTGCVVAVVRKLSGWNLDSVLGEYKSYAMPKIRDCDVDYISGFQPTSLQPMAFDSPRFSPVQTRTFFRTLLFSTFVMVVWLVSGSKLNPSSGNPAA
ncbi:tyrosine phosphatase family protein [Hirsutella rhossiliensis]|uniref:diphosphoinositol-polyphosphate diphosphatase n=1 Tax=Hirsutella rhossiliensis TaxID=111463 RepID=A0A9P8SMN5_9HYPO|nr:tyrosine phosphatase family domain-containing protein [Hirsutella rhossiliensis]KAH0966321.1 tyrosine phosphatase family domain-containing protein [Hirsutella rhossiliensis]